VRSLINDFIKPVLVLAVICIVVAGALAFVNDATYPIIEEAAAERARLDMQAIMPDAVAFEPLDTEDLASITEAYQAVGDAGQPLGYIIVAASNGFGGEMRVMCGIGPDGRIIEVRTLQHSETRGFGDYIEHEHPSAFTRRLEGKDSRLEGIDGVTGATVTFRAFVTALEEAFNAFEELKG